MAWPLNKPHGSGTQNYIKIKTDDFHDDIDSRPGSGRGGAGGARPTYSAGHGPQHGNTGRNSYSSSGREVGSGGAKHHGGYGGPSGSAHVLQALEARQAEQNSGLAHLDSSVTRLGELSLGISREIDLQNRMLDQLEDETDRAQGQADMLTRKTADLVKQAGGPKTCLVITVLTAVFVLLFLLVIYT